MATADEVLQMDRAALEVRRTMALALAWVEDKEGGLFGAAFETDAERQIAGAIRNNKHYAEEWLTTSRSWAEQGKDVNGFPYSVSWYLGVGAEIAKTFTFDLGETYHQDVFRLTVSQSVQDVEQGAITAAVKVKGAMDFLSSTKGKVLVGTLAALLVGGVLVVARATSPARLVRA